MSNKKELPTEKHWLDRMLEDNGMVRQSGKPRHYFDGSPVMDATGQVWTPVGSGHFTNGEPGTPALSLGALSTEERRPLIKQTVDD
jgi:hypothetical protein